MTDVRERLAEVLDVWEVFTSGDGLRSIRARTAEELADAILSDSELVDALVRSRLEQVGWRIPDDAGPDAEIIHDDTDVPHIHHDECEPVYRIKGET